MCQPLSENGIKSVDVPIGDTCTVTEEYPYEKGYGYKIEMSGAAEKMADQSALVVCCKGWTF